MRFHPTLVCIVFLLSCLSLHGQDVPYTNIYLSGNTEGLDVKSVFMNQLLVRVENDTIPSHLLFLGDFSSKTKLKKSLTEKLHSLKKEQDIGLRFIPGDKEWSGLDAYGSSHSQKLESNIEKELKKAFTPNKGCPGPHEIELDKNTVLISINTSWFLTGHAKKEGFSSNCPLLFESEFWEELDDLIEDSKGKNIIIAGHHPVYSNGFYAGKGARLIEWIPLLGSMFYAYRNHDGSADYLSNKRYQHFRTMMERVLKKHQGLIYLSGHEHSIEIQNVDGNLHVNSGAANSIKKGANKESSLFTQYQKGFTCLSFFKDGRVKAKVFNTDLKQKSNSFVDYVMLSPCTDNIAQDKIINTQFSDCEQTHTSSNTTSKNDQVALDSGKTVPGKEYKAGGFKTFWMGEHYRKEWITEVTVPYLDLKTDFGGLRAYGKGGGKQTNSLKLVNNKKERFAFRSVNKNTGRDPYDPFRNTLVTSYTQELISNQLPFGDVLVSKLLDNTDILHMHPRPFIMPDDPALGIYRKDFAQVLGTVEEKPKGKKGKRPGFANADIIVSSNQMYKYLIKNNSNYIDHKAFAKTILFDTWVCDWDKHGDNWKWAGYTEKNHFKFVPIPKDRDHVFAIYEGLIPSIAKRIIPFYSDFKKELHDVRAITFQGRHLVNFVGSKLTLENWKEAARYLQESFNEENIDAAFEEMPMEMRDISKEEIKSKLHARLGQLELAAEEIYKIYNRVGLIVGTNDKEKFKITRNMDGSVHVLLQKFKNEKIIFEKTFYPEFTKEIRLYGLGKDDAFIVSGECAQTIPIRIIGGKGEDEIRDLAKISNDRIVTKIYDKQFKDKIESSSNTKIKRQHQDPEFDIFDFEYNSFIPLLSPSYSTDFGFFIVGNYTFINHGFNKPGYQHRLSGDFRWVPNLKNFKLKGKYRYRQFWGDRNLLVRYSMAINDFGFDDFFGIGNTTRRSTALNDNGFYDFNNSNFNLSVGMNRDFNNKSATEFGIGLEYYNTAYDETTIHIFALDRYSDLLGLGKTASGFLETQLDLDYLDNTAFPTRGARLELKHRISKLLTDGKNFYGKAEASLIEYYSFNLLKEATFAVKLGGSINYGDTPFYHLSSLGNSNNLRTYSTNVLLGTSSIYTNFQLRHSIGTLQNGIIPLNVGALLFYDIGRVFNNESFSFDNWSYGYGAGMYLSILDGAYNIHFSIGENQYDEKFYRLGLGFGLE